MFCPSCGQERISDETRFCSRCGFLLSGTYELLMTGGVIPQAPVGASQIVAPRTRGLKQGLFIFLLTFLVVPIVAIVWSRWALNPGAYPSRRSCFLSVVCCGWRMPKCLSQPLPVEKRSRKVCLAVHGQLLTALNQPRHSPHRRLCPPMPMFPRERQDSGGTPTTCSRQPLLRTQPDH